MKATLCTAVVALSLLGLSACASMDERDTALAPPSAADSPTIHTDAVYVATVEQLARKRGVRVEWVNPPRVHASQDRIASTDD